ncbi:hypothetical protein CAter282_3969 [Collimonas arenae]|uniref:Uncharacterized protein n=1 Tax=Collimonas arenae TaxID=279058 RepID=A0A127QNL7_9BURK|nr:hypothetical protein CAter10_4327 [Collimonas arenae]AMP11639.1 hypothetical protein CAter282_3969 [Collimonas arenae]
MRIGLITMQKALQVNDLQGFLARFPSILYSGLATRASVCA